FCSAFMAGPDEGFAKYTFFVNEESNDLLEVPAGAPYGSDPSIAPLRQAGLTAYYDTETGKYGVLPSAGRHNHENTVVVPGWKKGIAALSGDDTFTTTSTPARPNLSQMYMSRASNANHFIKDDGTLWAFRVTANNAGPVVATDGLNGANDYFDMVVGDAWKGEFIAVPKDVANGTTTALPQDALEDWSNANNVFQFLRVEDIAYDPDQPRVVYFADTGNTRLIEDPTTGRLYRGPNVSPPNPLARGSLGRIFKMTFSEASPTKVDDFTIVTEAESIGMRNPDNLDVGHDSLMVQEDTSNAKIWRYPLSTGVWSHVASATQPTAETSGIVDVSDWFGAGWWAVSVQSHVNQSVTTDAPFVWNGPPGPPVGTTYQKRRELGQLLLMHVEGS
ncbi:MAG: alkaline phosphatase PhoX, partial [Candidatus Limnocylindrales bacterium]